MTRSHLHLTSHQAASPLQSCTAPQGALTWSCATQLTVQAFATSHCVRGHRKMRSTAPAEMPPPSGSPLRARCSSWPPLSSSILRKGCS